MNLHAGILVNISKTFEYILSWKCVSMKWNILNVVTKGIAMYCIVVFSGQSVV